MQENAFTSHRSTTRLLAVGAAALAVGALTAVAFFADRLQVWLRDRGQRHDLVAAVFALGDDDLAAVGGSGLEVMHQCM